MDQSRAKTLFKEGAFLIVLDVPEGTEFGIDWNSWTTGPKFKGVKMIPPGIHFVFYSAVSKFDGAPAPRTSFFHTFKSQEIVVKRWHAKDEELVDESKTTDEIKVIKANLQDLDKNLAPYPYDTLKKWVSMSNNISIDIIKKCSPENGVIHSVLELMPEKQRKNDSPSSSQVVDKDGLPCMTANPRSVIRFTKVPDKWYPVDATPREISKHSMDSSYILGQLLQTYQQPLDVLGELQFAFVCFILGQVFDAFESWKKLVRVLCSCESSLQDNIELFKALIGVMYHQITEIPQDFFVDIVTSNNFLVTTLTILFSSIEQSCFDQQLQDRAKQFRKYLTKKFKWKFNAVPDDWAPVVVEI